MMSGEANIPRGEATIVCGPPGGGKTYYVREHANRGDVVVDLDVIGAALTVGAKPHAVPEHLLRFALAARDGVLRELRAPKGCPRAWVIGCLPSKRERNELAQSLRAKIIMLAVNAEECIKRIQSDSSRDKSKDWKKLVREWWENYQA